MFDQKPLLGELVNYGHPLSRGLVGLWLFNEDSGGQVFDLSGDRNTGTLVGDTHWVHGKFGSALDFDKASDYVDCGTAVNVSVRVSVWAWVKLDSIDVANYARMFLGRASFGANLEGDFSITIQASAGQSNPGQCRFNIVTSDGADGVQDSVNAPTGEWLFIVGTFDGTIMRLYKNAVELGTLSRVGSFNNNAHSTYFGAFHNAVATTTLDGQISHGGICNYVLPASEIVRLYQEPFCMFRRRRRIIYDEIAAAPAALARFKVHNGLADPSPLVRGLVA